MQKSKIFSDKQTSMVRIKMRKLFGFIRICRLLYEMMTCTVMAMSSQVDTNCPLDPTKRLKGGILIPRQRDKFDSKLIQNEFSLHDIWRIKNPNTRGTKNYMELKLSFHLLQT